MRQYLVEQTAQLLILMYEDEIERKFRIGKLHAKTRIFNDEIEKWVFLIEHPVFYELTRNTKAQTSAVMISDHRNWYFLRNSAPVGAFTYLEMIRLLQHGMIGENNFVWRAGYLNWLPVEKSTDFSKENIKLIYESNIPGVQNYFRTRKSPRIPFAADFVVHNCQQVWQVTGLEIGAFGIKVATKADLKINEIFYLHMLSSHAIKPFSAQVRVVWTEPNVKIYGLEFIDIHRDDQKNIAELTSNTILGKNLLK